MQKTKLLFLEQYLISYPEQALWTNVMTEMFSAFRQRQIAQQARTVPIMKMNSPGLIEKLGFQEFSLQHLPSTSSTAAQRKTPAGQFVISIKPRADDYPKLDHDWKWRDWKKNFKPKDMVHPTDKVLDPNFSPATEEMMELFCARKRLMYNVFVRCLKTAKGIVAVKAHALTQDSKPVHTKLVKDYKHGLLTENIAEKLQNKIMKWRLDLTQEKDLFNTLTTC